MNDRPTGTYLLGRFHRAAALLVAVALAGAVLAVVLGGGGQAVPVYTSRSLVVANEWEQRIEGLGRLANAIIETDSFERRLLDTDSEAFVGIEAETTFDAVAVLDTVAVWIEAEGPSAELAKRRANLAAETLVAELGRLGEGTGTFSIQDPASTARLRTDRHFRAPARAAIGGVAALLLGAGVMVAWPRRRVRGPLPALDELVEASAAEAEAEATAARIRAVEDHPNVVWIPLPLDPSGTEPDTAEPASAMDGYLRARRSPKLQ